MKHLLLSVLLILLVSGCSTRGAKAYKPPKKIFSTSLSKAKPSYIPKEKNWITKALYKEYKKWYKTPYKYGGTTLKGVDCSAFTQSVYFYAFGIKIPRTTSEQIKMGIYVKRKNIQVGDLLFFQTSSTTKHTGIVIEKDKFMHTSTKYGVSISSINNPYWRGKYTLSKRLLFSD